MAVTYWHLNVAVWTLGFFNVEKKNSIIRTMYYLYYRKISHNLSVYLRLTNFNITLFIISLI